MRIWMLVCLIVAVGVVPVFGQELVPPGPEDEKAEPPAPAEKKKLTLEEEIASLTGELAAGESALRDAAARRLVEIGPQVIGPVEKLLESEEADVRFRAKKILDELHYVTKQDREKIEKQIDLCLWGGEEKELDEETKKLIEDLSSDDWQTREDAVKKLIEKGPAVLREFSKMLDSEDLDQKDRAEKIIKAIRENAKSEFEAQLTKSLSELECIVTAPYYLVNVLGGKRYLADLAAAKKEKAREEIVGRLLRGTAGLLTMADLRNPQRRAGRSMSIMTTNGQTRVVIDGKEVQIIAENASPENVLGFIAADDKIERELRLLAVKALEAREAVNAVETLVGLLGKSRGAIQLAVAETLRKLTAQDFGPTRESTLEQVDEALQNWSKWWEENKEKQKYRFSEAPGDGSAPGAIPLGKIGVVRKQVRGALKKAREEAEKKEKEEEKKEPEKKEDDNQNKERDF